MKLTTVHGLTRSLPEVFLTRDITKHLKRGHRWIFANSFDEKDTSQKKSGFYSLYYKNELIGYGVLQPDSYLRFRVFCLNGEPYFRKNSFQKTFEFWEKKQWEKALIIRRGFDLNLTNSFRLVNGEGDGLPGLVIDIYQNVAVIKHDHPAMESIWNRETIAQEIIRDFPQINCVFHKRKGDDREKGETFIGKLPEETLFKENGMIFASNIREASKTGFFLDQRDNRHLIRHFSRNADVLNLFSYTGGFSIFAAAGGARRVTSVDIGKNVIAAVQRNFEINQLKTEHIDVVEDAFKFTEEEISKKSKYDMVITDPPSFAPNEKSVPQAISAYSKIFTQSIRLVRENGFFAASSCSSHIPTETFLDIVRASFSKANKKGTLVHLGAQPFDHPYPLAMPELRYLKFALLRVE